MSWKREREQRKDTDLYVAVAVAEVAVAEEVGLDIAAVEIDLRSRVLHDVRAPNRWWRTGSASAAINSVD